MHCWQTLYQILSSAGSNEQKGRKKKCIAVVFPVGRLCQGPLCPSGGPTCTCVCIQPTSCKAGKVAGSHTYWKAISNLPSCLKQVKAGSPKLSFSLSFMGPTCQITIPERLLWLLLQTGEFLLTLEPLIELRAHTHTHTRRRNKGRH